MLNWSWLCWNCRERVRAPLAEPIEYRGARCRCGAVCKAPHAGSTKAPKKARRGRWKKLYKQVVAERIADLDYKARLRLFDRGHDVVWRRDYFKKPAVKPERRS